MIKETDTYDQNHPALAGVLTKDEKVIGQAYIHWGIFWMPAVVLFFALILLIQVFEIGLIILVFGLLLLGRAYLHYRVMMFVITNKRVLMRYGLLQMDVVDMRFKHIESIELERMPTAMIMGYSTLQIMGTGQRIVRIPYVANGPQIRRVYNDIVLEGETT